MILTFSGASGTGKTTLMQELGKRFPDRSWLIPSVTTRPKRLNELEINGTHEYQREFRPDMIFSSPSHNTSTYIKVYEYGENKYATEIQKFIRALKDEKGIYMAALTLPGPLDWQQKAEDLMHEDKWLRKQKLSPRNFVDVANLHSIFLDLSGEEERRSRLRRRGETNSERFRDELASLRAQAQALGVQFLYLDAREPPEMLADHIIKQFKLAA